VKFKYIFQSILESAVNLVDTPLIWPFDSLYSLGRRPEMIASYAEAKQPLWAQLSVMD